MENQPKNADAQYIPENLQTRDEVEKWCKEQVESGRASKGFVGAMLLLDMAAELQGHRADAYAHFRKVIDSGVYGEIPDEEKQAVLVRAEKMFNPEA